MMEGFKGALQAATDWLMRYDPNRWYFSIAHACVVLIVSIVGYIIAADSPSIRDLAADAPFYLAMLPFVLLFFPMRDEKKGEQRALTCLTSIGMAFAVAIAALVVEGFLSIRPFF